MADATGAAPSPPDGAGRGRGALIIALMAGAAVLWLFVGKERKPPQLTPTLEHRASTSARDKAACLSCHQRGTAPKRPNGHTGREDCWSCHEVT